jgi:hypothetical protein
MDIILRTLLKRGADHTLQCEDSLCHFIHDNHQYIAIFDGCSTGINSHFASELMSKIFKKSVSEVTSHSNYLNKVKDIVKRMKEYLTTFHLIYGANRLELLSTVVFAVINPKDNTGILVFLGDGVAIVNGETIINNQDNKPDYMGNYMSTDMSVDEFISEHCIIKYLTNVSDISVCSDGILSFQKLYESNGINCVDKTDTPVNESIEKLCIDTRFKGTESMLSRIHNLMERDKYQHYDDLSIVRLILTNNEEQE